MLHNIQSSIRKHVEDRLDLPCYWIFDGVELPAARPIATIEALPANYGTQAKLRDVVAIRYRFQIGVLSSSSGQAARLPHELADLLTFEPVPLLDTKNGGAVIGEIEATVTAITPIMADRADSTQKHKTYIDVTVACYRGR